jgi:hypothetical protein
MQKDRQWRVDVPNNNLSHPRQKLADYLPEYTIGDIV